MIGAVPNHVETAGVLLTAERNPQVGTTRTTARASSRSRPGRGAARDLGRHPSRSSKPVSASHCPKTLQVLPMSSSALPRLANPGPATAASPDPEHILHIAPFPDQRTRCGRARQHPLYVREASGSSRTVLLGTGLSCSISGFPWTERLCPRTRRVPTTPRTTAPVLSSTTERPAYGAANVSMKPNRPNLTLTRSPPMVATMNPAPATTTSSRRQSSRTTARTTPAIPWSRNSGPIVGIVR